MKKNLCLAALAVLTLTGCGSNSTSTTGTSTTGTSTTGTSTATTNLKIAMLTDAGSVTDGSYNQTTWEAIQAYKADNSDKVSEVKYYRPAKSDTSAFEDAIQQAVVAGFNTIVCPGYYFAEAFENVADNYPTVNFIGLDFTTATTHKNVSCISFKENESGVLAGYAAVVDGYRKLGFFGGMAQPAPIRYGLGYIYGAYYAAHELGLKDFSIDPSYVTYAGSYLADSKFNATGTAWYDAGVEVIFTAAGGAGDSIIAVSDADKGHMIIGVDTDESGKKTSVITSATKGLKSAIYIECNKILDNTFTGGASSLGIKEDCCDIVLGDTARFKNTDTVTKVKSFMSTLKAGTVTVPSYSDTDTSLADFKTALTALGYEASDALVNAIKGDTK